MYAIIFLEVHEPELTLEDERLDALDNNEIPVVDCAHLHAPVHALYIWIVGCIKCMLSLGCYLTQPNCKMPS